MSENRNKWTPEEWLLDDEQVPPVVYCVKSEFHEPLIAHLDPGRAWTSVDVEEAEANARLIAAAPDLYEALELLSLERHEMSVSGDADDHDTCKHCGKNYRNRVHYRVGESYQGDMGKARAALAKARAQGN